MDLVNYMDGAVIGSIMAIMEVVKTVDKGHKAGRWYPLVVLVLAVAFALFKAQPLNWQNVGYYSMVYGGSASFIFKLGKTSLLGK